MNPTKAVIKPDGFTIVEIIVVLVLVGLLVGLVIPRFIDFETSSTDRVVDSAIAELNGRENLIWVETIWSDYGYTGDATLQAAINYDLGSEYVWNDPPGQTGGTVEFREKTYTLIRTPSTEIRHGVWSR